MLDLSSIIVAALGGVFGIAGIMGPLVYNSRINKKTAAIVDKTEHISTVLGEIKLNVDGRLTQFIDLANRTQTELASLKAALTSASVVVTPEIKAAIEAPAPAVNPVVVKKEPS